jgi:hypothetical protein
MKGSKLKGELRSVDINVSGNSKHQTVTKQRFLRFIRHPDATTLVLGIVIALAVCAPLMSGGRVLLLDWTFGPHLSIASPGALGLNGGLTSGVVGSETMVFFNHLLGSASTSLPILIFFPVATVGAGRLAGRSRWSRMAAGTLYAVNPFVFNRLYVGHLPLLIGYALLPFATAAAIRSLSSPAIRWLQIALWWTVLTSLSPHFAWIFGVVIVGVVVASVLTKQHPIGREIGWFATVTGAFALMSTYILLPHAATNLLTQVGRVSLALYRTSSDPHLGLFANVISLYGFWRTGPGPKLPKDVVSGWPFLMLTIFLIAACGAWSALRKGGGSNEQKRRDVDAKRNSRQTYADGEIPIHENSNAQGPPGIDQRRLAILLLFAGVVGFLLALGDRGPTGWLFLSAYNHVPFFALMREPQKFLMLLALAYAVLFGWGVERLSHVNFSPRKISAIASAALLGVALPLGYTPTIFNGLARQITPSAIPTAYQQADNLMGTGPGNVLYLPWHLYMAYPFTNNRVVANVGPTSFSRNVISGDNVESGGVESQSTSPRSSYLQELFQSGASIKSFGALVAPLGVQYVVLAKTVDWASYGWLKNQQNLHLVLDTTSLEVWRNVAYAGVGHRVKTLTSVTNFKGLLTLAKFNELNGGAVVTSQASVSSSNAPASIPLGQSTSGASTSTSVQQLSPVAYRIPSGTPGWVTVDTPYQRGWSLNGRSAEATAEGTVLVRVGANGGVLQFTPWRMVRLGYILSLSVFVVIVVMLEIDRRRRTHRDPL